MGIMSRLLSLALEVKQRAETLRNRVDKLEGDTKLLYCKGCELAHEENGEMLCSWFYIDKPIRSMEKPYCSMTKEELENA